MSDYVLTVGDHDYEARKITLPRNRGVLIKFDFEDAPASALELPARGDEGIDVSRHQGLFDWNAAMAMGVTWAYIRATMGAPSKAYSGIDDRWRHNRERARGAGIADGVYHFFTPDSSSDDQADNFVREVEDDFGKLPIVVDVERRRVNGVAESINKVDFTARLHQFLIALESHYGHKPLIYTSKLEWEAMTILPAWESEYGFFVAQYAPALTAIRPQWRVMAWQYSTSDGKLDRDRWMGGDAPAPVVSHNFAPRRNQDVINLFARVFGGAYIEKITEAGIAHLLFGARQEVYSGPDVEDLTLTNAEKAALIGAMG